MNSNEFKRWLLKQGVTFENARGSHVKLHLNGRQSVLPMHPKELKTGKVEGIKKQLGRKESKPCWTTPSFLTRSRKVGSS